MKQLFTFTLICLLAACNDAEQTPANLWTVNESGGIAHSVNPDEALQCGIKPLPSKAG